MATHKQAEWKGKSRGGSLGHLFFILTIKYLGVGAAYTLLLFVVPYFIPFAPKATASIWYYNRNILHYSRLKAALMLFVSYYRFGQTIIDKVACSGGLVNKFKFEFDNFSNFIEQLNRGEGVVIIGAHIGSWEMGGSFFEDYGKKMNIVMYDAEFQKIKDVVEKHSAGRNYKIIPLNEDPITSILKIKMALDANEYVCFQGDRFLNTEKTITTQFMGQDAKFPLGPFLVASRMKASVIFYFAMREKGRCYKFYFKQALPIARKAGVHPEFELFEQYKKELEQVVHKYPQQWFNFYHFWS